MTDLSKLIDIIVPDVVAAPFISICEQTGLRWGPTSRAQYWFQPPKLHIALFVVVVFGFCYGLYRASRGYKTSAIAALSARGVGRSIKCPINRAIAVVLMVCLASQVYMKSIRPQPLIQLGWLLMPCHLTTAAWIYVMLSEKVTQYGRACYVATLLMDWYWGPVLAALTPDWGDHQYWWEGHAFIIHHGMLLLLPVYFAARYDVLELDRSQLYHLTWVSTLINFGFFAPYSLLTGLNLDYMLYPPPAMLKDSIFNTPFYRPLFVPVLMFLSFMDNYMIRGVAHVLCRFWSEGRRAKRKIM